MRDTDWTKVLGWPGYRVYRQQIDESNKTLKLWVRRKRGHRKLVCSGCGRKLSEVYDSYERAAGQGHKAARAVHGSKRGRSSGGFVFQRNRASRPVVSRRSI